MEYLFGRFFDCNSLLFLLDAFHQLFSIGVLTGHDIADTKVGQDNSSDRKQVIHLTTNKWFVVADCIAILVILHEEYVSNIELPSFVLAAEFGGLAEDFLYHRVIAVVPVYLGLHHEDRDVLIEGQIVFLKSIVDGFTISGNSCVLDRLGLLSESINMFVSQIFKLSEGFFF